MYTFREIPYNFTVFLDYAPFSISFSLLKNAVSWYICRGWEGTVDKFTFVRIRHRKS